MLKRKVLYAADTCLRDYVSANSCELPAKVGSYLMDRHQLSAFYSCMIDDLASKKASPRKIFTPKAKELRPKRSLSAVTRPEGYLFLKKERKGRMNQTPLLYCSSGSSNLEKSEPRPNLAEENRIRRKSCNFRAREKQKTDYNQALESKQKQWISEKAVQKYLRRYYQQYNQSNLKQICNTTGNLRDREDEYDQAELQMFKNQEQVKYLMRKKIKIADHTGQFKGQADENNRQNGKKLLEKKVKGKNRIEEARFLFSKKTQQNAENSPPDSKRPKSKKEVLREKLSGYLLKKNRYMPYF